MSTTTVSTPPASCRPAGIDHLSYPHLIDGIFAHAPRASLLALRGACRDFRRRADALFAAHVVVSALIPAQAAARHGGGRIPALAPERAGGEPDKKRRYARALRDTRVVDVLGDTGTWGQNLLGGGVVLGEGGVVRMLQPSGGRLSTRSPVVAGTMVVFATFSEARYWSAHDDRDVGHPARAQVTAAPKGVRRFVLNLRYDPRRVWLAQAYVAPLEFECAESIEEVVLVFTPKTTHREDEVNPVMPARRRAGMLNTLVFGMSSSIPRVKYVLVDAHLLQPAWLGLGRVEGERGREDTPPLPPLPSRVASGDDTPTTDGILAAVFQTLQGVFGRTPDVAVASLGAITFMTRKEYARSVGEAQFALETSE